MNVVVAIDSFKGSMSSIEAGEAIKKGIQTVFPEADVLVMPVADGGEGTTEALVQGLGGEMIPLRVCGPMGEQVEASYGYIKEKNLAIVEMAKAAGLTLVNEEQRDPSNATTFGVGELIAHAVNQGCRDFIVGIGGSATNDAGLGMLSALGFRFKDQHGKLVGRTAKSLELIQEIDCEHRMPELSECRFRIACDVTNPLYGEQGATYIYGPQKGVSLEEREELDQHIRHFANITADAFHRDDSFVPGAGAAGGLGFAFLSFLSGTLTPGIDLVMQVTNLEEQIKKADYVITGEGRMDLQTSMGKLPVGVAKLAKCHGKKVLAFAGGVTKDANLCNEAGIDAFFPILREVVTLQEAMNPETATNNLTQTVQQVFRLIQLLERNEK